MSEPRPVRRPRSFGLGYWTRPFRPDRSRLRYRLNRKVATIRSLLASTVSKSGQGAIRPHRLKFPDWDYVVQVGGVAARSQEPPQR